MRPVAEKVDIRQGLIKEAMSPEASEEDTVEDNDNSASENENDSPQDRRKIVTRPLSWRSERFASLLNSLDRKWIRKCSPKARSMMKKRYVCAPVAKQAPHHKLDAPLNDLRKTDACQETLIVSNS